MQLPQTAFAFSKEEQCSLDFKFFKALFQLYHKTEVCILRIFSKIYAVSIQAFVYSNFCFFADRDSFAEVKAAAVSCGCVKLCFMIEILRK